ncbi:MAG: tRNA (adenosine(37)-N6)-threonylcarbamoyltransferase complex dimerization subunit type 1 TsaB [Candidatus Cloacimonetes bacterium]|nr:tRNA (adenosine(37)-N6)-threonylcarbamoyltransferase complex dimerization subunit type 1 TsaB [Candidatus Cloacimonadota bacterium]
MKLAIDTSQSSGSIALWDKGKTAWSSCFDIRITHSETLMPQIDAAMKFCGYKPSDIETLLVTSGPGSFTGLRIGLATAKGMAYALKIPLLTYTSLHLYALQRYHCGKDILVALDAKMHEVYAALYNEKLEELQPPQVCTQQDILSWKPRECYLIQKGVKSLESLTEENGLTFISVPDLPISAAGLFLLEEIFPQPEVYDLDYVAHLEPNYLREHTAQIKGKNKII